MRGFNIYEWMVQVIQDLYGNTSSAVLINEQQGSSFRTSLRRGPLRKQCRLPMTITLLFP
ncbi:hypothetical protein DPMN_110614 [Dreissena polymorpha]|uniref:Uncharacterized protein n=1 Tax=Dreissena polymorpha TaxID=45954 RepID=A0A9D4KCE2_DREPO|nr:hypothetical protein DPMN_110614 [Dreissena polymorpha]